MKLEREALTMILEMVSRGEGYEACAQTVACTRRTIYNMLENSRRAMQADQPTVPVDFPTKYLERPKWTPYYFRWRDEATWFHLHMLRARDPYLKDVSLVDCSDEDLDKLGIPDRYLRNEHGEKIRLTEMEGDDVPDLRDLDDLRELAKVAPTNPRPIGRVEIGGRPDGGPQEQITGQQPQKSVAERERAHARAAPEGWSGPPLQKPDKPPPVWAKPSRPIEGAGRGNQAPPDDFRMTVSTRSYSRAERIAHHGAMRVHDGKK